MPCRKGARGRDTRVDTAECSGAYKDGRCYRMPVIPGDGQQHILTIGGGNGIVLGDLRGRIQTDNAFLSELASMLYVWRFHAKTRQPTEFQCLA